MRRFGGFDSGRLKKDTLIYPAAGSEKSGEVGCDGGQWPSKHFENILFRESGQGLPIPKNFLLPCKSGTLMRILFAGKPSQKMIREAVR
jgi:hypothetical protein